MENKLKQFLDNAFEPYGNFPSRTDVIKELITNLTEKYQDLKQQGYSDEEAYQATINSFGNVEEIMEQLPHSPKVAAPKQENNSGLFTTLKAALKQAKASMGMSKFAAIDLKQADLSDSNLAEGNFSYSSLLETKFNRSIVTDAMFMAAALKGSSFENSNLTNSIFGASDLQEVNFNGANLTNTKFRASALQSATFENSTLVNTTFITSDLSTLSFNNLELNGVIFNASSLKGTTFKNATLRNVSFHHSDVKHTIFDGAKMDKVTYALLKSAKANLENVEII
jgi:BTB/POZ domain-containing protein KCTD9